VYEVELEMQMEELRRAREESETSSRRYADLFDDAPVALLCLDGGGFIVDANVSAATLLGVERGALLKKPLAAFMAIRDADTLHLLRRETLRSRAKRARDVSLRGRDGTLRTVQVVLSVPSAGPTGECRCALIDVTDLRLAEEARRAAEAKTQAMLDAAPDAIVTMNREGRIASLNAAAERIFHFSPEELIGQSIECLVPAVASDLLVTRRLTEGVRKDGSRFPVEIDVAEWQGKSEPMLTAICRDVSVRENALARLQETQNRFALITDHIEDVLYVIDANGRLSYVSPAFERIWAARSILVCDRIDAWPPKVHTEDRAEVQAARATLRRADPVDLEYRIVREDGTVRWIHDRATPIEDEHGHVTCVVGVARDKTIERELEIELAQAQKMETLGALSSGIAHDFNNVLQVVVGAITLAAEEDVPWDQASQYLERAKAVALRAGELVQRISGFARRQPAKRRALAIDQMLRDASTIVRPLLGEHIKLVLRLDARGAFVFATQVQLEQILLNLVSNSRDAMSSGGTVTLRSRRIVDSAHSGERIRIELTDTGSGMDEDTKSRALDPFFTTKKQGRGTGLGLASVLDVTEQLGGELRIDSEKGRGTTVTIELPACAPDLKASSSNIAVQPFHGTALLVEDEPLVRKTLRRQLERLGFSVLEAEGGPQGLEFAAESAPDVLVCDVLMPQMTGPKLAACLREHYPTLPVLFISGEGDHGFAELAEKTRYLPKPFDPATLATELAFLLRPEPAKPKAPTLLVVESDAGQRQRLKKSLAAAHMRVFAVGTGEEAKAMATSWAIDVLVSNVHLSDGPGDALAAEIARLHPKVATFYVFEGEPPPLEPACAASDLGSLVTLIEQHAPL
jgi:PAS domain S-box-containing protein